MIIIGVILGIFLYHFMSLYLNHDKGPAPRKFKEFDASGDRYVGIEIYNWWVATQPETDFVVKGLTEYQSNRYVEDLSRKGMPIALVTVDFGETCYSTAKTFNDLIVREEMR